MIASDEYDYDYRKVTVATGNKATHITDPNRDEHTLCGLQWFFDCDQGTDHYCRKCQRILAKRRRQ
jgi:hypothetical protein